MSRKQYAAGDVYERKLKRVMERLEVSEYNFNWDRHGAWIEFRLRGELYRFDHSTDKAQARGINIRSGDSNGHVEMPVARTRKRQTGSDDYMGRKRVKAKCGPNSEGTDE